MPTSWIWSTGWERGSLDAQEESHRFLLCGHGFGEGNVGVLSSGVRGAATVVDSGAGRCLPETQEWPFLGGPRSQWSWRIRRRWGDCRLSGECSRALGSWWGQGQPLLLLPQCRRRPEKQGRGFRNTLTVYSVPPSSVSGPTPCPFLKSPLVTRPSSSPCARFPLQDRMIQSPGVGVLEHELRAQGLGRPLEGTSGCVGDRKSVV